MFFIYIYDTFGGLTEVEPPHESGNSNSAMTIHIVLHIYIHMYIYKHIYIYTYIIIQTHFLFICKLHSYIYIQLGGCNYVQQWKCSASPRSLSLRKAETSDSISPIIITSSPSEKSSLKACRLESD